jgi:enoyl-CoA hydratase/carnithine racemase
MNEEQHDQYADHLLVERTGRVLRLTLNDPATRNALHAGIYRTGIEALQQAGDDPGIGAVVLSGNGGTFCSGGNLHAITARRQQSPEVQAAAVRLFHDWIAGLRQCPKPVLAAVEGKAAGGGFSLALACDLIVAATDAQFLMAYVKVGLSSDGGASWALARSLTPQLALEILLGGDAIAAPRLHQWGLVNRLCEPGQALTETLRWAERLAEGPAFAISQFKQLVAAAPANSLPAHLEQEQAAFLACVRHPQASEGIAAFLEKRRADFVAHQT